MLVRILICYCCSFIVTANVVAQEDNANIISSIRFSGINKTQPIYLKLFVHSKVDEPLFPEIVEADVQRLKNLIGVGNATYHLDTTGQTINLIFDIVEVKTLLPIINFGGIRGNVWFQLGFADANWRGKGHFLSGTYQNIDQRHSGGIFYRIPRILRSEWGGSVSLSTWSSREPLFFPEGTVNYDYDIKSVGATAIRNLGVHHTFEFGGTFFLEQYEKSGSQFLEDTPGPDALTQPKLLGKWEYRANFLNYHFFYLDGLTWRTTIQNVFNTDDQTWFNSLQVQGKYFRRIGKKGNLAFRLRLGLATNNDTPFAPYVLDSNVNIRGVGNRIDRGTAQVILNTEYRHTIQTSDRWAMQLVVFSDSGTWRNPGGSFDDLLDPDQFRQFIGGGFRLIYRKFYGAVLRIDYGFDTFNKKQHGLVIGFGQYF